MEVDHSHVTRRLTNLSAVFIFSFGNLEFVVGLPRYKM